MKAVIRTAAVVLAVMGLVLVAAGAAIAASPEPTVGGVLTARGNTIMVTSGGNVPAHVVMAADYVTLSEVSFDLAPGEKHRLTYEGAPTGYVSATFTVIRVSDSGESGSATLSVGLSATAPPFTIPWGSISGVLVVLAGLAFLMRRLKPWRWRIVVTP